MSEWIGRKIGSLWRGARREMEKSSDAFSQAGLKIQKDSMLLLRLQFLSQVHDVVDDPRLDIDDRIRYLNRMITMVNMAWGRGAENEVWASVYTQWQRMMAIWVYYESQRGYYRPRYRVIAEVKEELPELDVQASSSTTPKTVFKWVERPMRPETFVAKYLDDIQNNRFGQTATIKLKDIRQEKQAIDPTWGFDVVSPPELIEDRVRRRGESIWIPDGMIVLNYGFSKLDVSVQQVLVLHSAQPQFGGQSVVPTGSLGEASVLPSSKPAPSVMQE